MAPTICQLQLWLQQSATYNLQIVNKWQIVNLTGSTCSNNLQIVNVTTPANLNLTLALNLNLNQIVNVTTPANYFHVLRRQVKPKLKP